MTKDRPEQEAHRTLKRVDQETLGGGVLGSIMPRANEPVPSADEDWIEHWGTRIGRWLGLAITIAVIGWSLFYLVYYL